MGLLRGDRYRRIYNDAWPRKRQTFRLHKTHGFMEDLSNTGSWQYFTFHTDNLEIYPPVTCPIKEVGPGKLVYFCTLALAPFQTFSFILESCIVLSNCFIFGRLTGTCWCILFLLRCFRRYLTEFTGVQVDLCFSNELDVRSRDWCLRHFP